MSFLFSSQCVVIYSIHSFFWFISVSSPASSPIRLVSNSFIPVGRKPPRPPATHHIAALTVGPPVHGVEMLAPQLGPACSAHKASHVEDAIQGHDPGPVPDHVFSAATAPAWGRRGTGSTPSQAWKPVLGSCVPLTLQSHLPEAGGSAHRSTPRWAGGSCRAPASWSASQAPPQEAGSGGPGR